MKWKVLFTIQKWEAGAGVTVAEFDSKLEADTAVKQVRAANTGNYGVWALPLYEE